MVRQSLSRASRGAHHERRFERRAESLTLNLPGSAEHPLSTLLMAARVRAVVFDLRGTLMAERRVLFPRRAELP